MSVIVEPWDDAGDLGFEEPCKYGHEECSDTFAGACTAPTGLARAEQNVLSVIEKYDDGICTPHIVRAMLNSGLSEGALSVTKRIANLRKAGYPILGGLRDGGFCQISRHGHRARVGIYWLDI